MSASSEPCKASLIVVGLEIERLTDARISMLGLLLDLVLTTLPLLTTNHKLIQNICKHYRNATCCDVCVHTGHKVVWWSLPNKMLKTLLSDHLLLNIKYFNIAILQYDIIKKNNISDVKSKQLKFLKN